MGSGEMGTFSPTPYRPFPTPRSYDFGLSASADERMASVTS